MQNIYKIEDRGVDFHYVLANNIEEAIDKFKKFSKISIAKVELFIVGIHE